jgi:hypothetical protein
MNLFELTDVMLKKEKAMRSKDFKRTPFTDWMDQLDRVCPECGRKFYMGKDDDVYEWLYGHDCEA